MPGLDLKKSFATDKTKELEGVWHDIGNGAQLLIARSGNQKYNEQLSRIPRGIRQRMAQGLLSDDDTRDMVCKILADTILLDWKNIYEGGKEVKYSRDNAYRLLHEYETFRELVSELSNDLSNYMLEDLEGDIKNSKASSDGS